jgi:methionine-rich copper-binding protein CopC
MIPMRRLAALVAATTIVLAAPALVLGHVHLESTTPEAADDLDDPPGEVVIEFDGELNPDGSGFTVHGPGEVEVGTGEVDLSVADRNILRGDVTITEPGIYTVEYSVVGDDGHEVAGEFSFGYQASEPVPQPTDDDGHHPATAVAPSTGGALIALGANLLLAGILLGLAGLAGRLRKRHRHRFG